MSYSTFNELPKEIIILPARLCLTLIKGINIINRSHIFIIHVPLQMALCLYSGERYMTIMVLLFYNRLIKLIEIAKKPCLWCLYRRRYGSACCNSVPFDKN